MSAQPALKHPAPQSVLPNSYWVVPGRLLAGEHPGAHTLSDTTDRLQALLFAGDLGDPEVVVVSTDLDDFPDDPSCGGSLNCPNCKLLLPCPPRECPGCGFVFVSQ